MLLTIDSVSVFASPSAFRVSRVFFPLKISERLFGNSARSAFDWTWRLDPKLSWGNIALNIPCNKDETVLIVRELAKLSTSSPDEN